MAMLNILLHISTYLVDFQVYMGLTDVELLMGDPVYAASVHVHPHYDNLKERRLQTTTLP